MNKMKLKVTRIYTLEEIFNCANQFSSYYRELYQGIKFKSLQELPIVNQEKFWKSEVLTRSPNGIVFKSGGSTGNPKYSYFTHDEWQSYCEIFGFGLSHNILKKNDKVANLFYGGDLYASFFFIKDSLHFADRELKLSHFPIAGQTESSHILESLNEFKINVLCGVPSALVILVNEYVKNKELYPNITIERILYGGEGMYADQMDYLKSVFPALEISSIGCASVDGGMIGYSSPDCQSGEHRVVDEVGIIEIIDPDTNEVIKEKNITGKLLLTNLTRTLMPIVRYPAGDMAMWLEDDGAKNRKFKLCGRSDEAARLGTLSIYFEDTRELIKKSLKNSSNLQFQMIVKHYDHKDEMTFKLSGIEASQKEEIMSAFSKHKKTYLDLLEKKLIHPLKIEIVEVDQLVRNSRTGKLMRIVDLRK